MDIKAAKPRPLGKPFAVAALIVALLLGYVGGYVANRDGRLIVYTDGWDERTVPRYIALQEASEIVFWPLFQAHKIADPTRFNLKKQATPPEVRDEWF